MVVNELEPRRHQPIRTNPLAGMNKILANLFGSSLL
jgi:hypothetical protein